MQCSEAETAKVYLLVFKIPKKSTASLSNKKEIAFYLYLTVLKNSSINIIHPAPQTLVEAFRAEIFRSNLSNLIF